MKAKLLLGTKTVLADGRLIQRLIWQLPAATTERPHGLKYRLYCGRHGTTIVRYDNEQGKGDHKHIGPDEQEVPYRFESLTKLLADFAEDIETLSGEIV
ncbi:toxin-antitoxin system TumE family protein [Methylomagnum sp.]